MANDNIMIKPETVISCCHSTELWHCISLSGGQIRMKETLMHSHTHRPTTHCETKRCRRNARIAKFPQSQLFVFNATLQWLPSVATEKSAKEQRVWTRAMTKEFFNFFSVVVILEFFVLVQFAEFKFQKKNRGTHFDGTPSWPSRWVKWQNGTYEKQKQNKQKWFRPMPYVGTRRTPCLSL